LPFNIAALRTRLRNVGCVTLLAAFACGSKDNAPAKSAASATSDAALVARLPRSATFIARVDVERLQKSALYPAVISFFRMRGWGKLLTLQQKQCGFSALGALRELGVSQGPDGLVMAATTRVADSDVLECVQKVAAASGDGATPTGKVSPSRARAFGYLFAADGGVVFAGEPTGVMKALDDARNDARATRFALGPDTVAVLRGDLGELTVDGEVSASRTQVGARFTVRFPTEEAAGGIYDRVSKARARALEDASRSLARDVLKSLQLSLQGKSLEVGLGITGDLPIQERYLDVLLGILDVFYREYEGSAGTAPRAER
jgi:hypothetical protein